MLSRIIGLLLIILLLPLFIVISLIIVLDDGFPIIFIQKRIGKNKKTFNIYKFRTMKKNTKNIATHLMEREDSVILKSGHFIRKYSIDELPQAINIVFGNMNFIGPRPALYNQKKLNRKKGKKIVNKLKKIRKPKIKILVLRRILNLRLMSFIVIKNYMIKMERKNSEGRLNFCVEEIIAHPSLILFVTN